MQILIEEKQIESAIEQTRLSGDRAAAARLLDFAAESNSDRLQEVLEVCGKILRLDQLLTIVWKHKKLDEAMPQVILSVGRICEKLEANEK